MTGERIPCPVCGTPMNRHAEKAEYRRETSAAGEYLAEVVMEIHTCPACGRVVERPAET